jgi:DNA-binding NtrC family response regulator/tetratricopeptide (TPR) repeat protein
MQLVADRFVAPDCDSGRAVDLATGGDVALVIGSAGTVPDQLRWVDRCSMLRGLNHRLIAPLIDFGLVGETSRFEAWACGPAWSGSAQAAMSACADAYAFLSAAGLSTGASTLDAVHTGAEGGGVVLPAAGTGYPQLVETSVDTMPLTKRGLHVIERPALAALVEMFDATGARPHVASLWGPSGSGKGKATLDVARAARTRGFVPVAARLIGTRYADLWRGRSLLVIGGGHEQGWSALLDTALADAQPHMLLIVGETECRHVDGVRLARVSADALLASICPRALAAPLERAARRLAERALGLPGRFQHLLWRQRTNRRSLDRVRLPGRRVAEQAPLYGSENLSHTSALVEPTDGRSTWPAPGELAALRRRRDAAIEDLSEGRHAPGTRQLRQAIGGLARRSDWTDAARGTLALAAALLRRGRTRAALAAVDEGREYARQSSSDTLLLEFARLSGEAWIDLARLDEAESVLASAVAAARAAGDGTGMASVSLSLARCLFWRGLYANAGTLLDNAAEHVRGRDVVRQRLLGARVAVGLRDVAAAMSHVLEAKQLSAREADVGAAVSSTAAFVHLAAGDLDAVERDLSESLALAKAGHDPLRAIRARFLRAEADRRSGRQAPAAAALKRLRRVMRAAPPLIRARWDLASAIASSDGDPNEIVARHVAATGLGALSLYAAGTAGAAVASPRADAFVEELVAILGVCQAAEDESEVLKQVCGRVRHHLRAAAVAFATVRDGRAEIVRVDGARIDLALAERTAAACITIAPHRHDDRIEAAAPVHYGGATIGVLCARWTLGSTDDMSRAASVLTMTAAAAAPMLAAAIATRADVPTGRDTELLGVSPAIADLRKAVERAASAPYPVLIDGESGSGKELVARAIHRGGPRRGRPFCTINCAALPDDLVEAELFGHARGAFTGAIGDRAGVFEEAHGGTLFLDEIGELAPRAQAKVLRVIQEGELRRVGENVSRRVDVRIVAATNRDLRREVEGGRFRLDLLYRLDVVHLTVAPLRDRGEDIVVLAEHYWREAAARVGSRATLAAATIAALARYHWPGNVRELQNVLAALAVRSARRGVIPPSALPAPFAVPPGADPSKLDDARRIFEERFVRAALVRTGGHRGRAAAELGVTRQGLTKLMNRLGISQ